MCQRGPARSHDIVRKAAGFNPHGGKNLRRGEKA